MLFVVYYSGSMFVLLVVVVVLAQRMEGWQLGTAVILVSAAVTVPLEH